MNDKVLPPKREHLDFYNQTNNNMASNVNVVEQQQEAELQRAEAELAATIAYVQSRGVKLPDTLLDMSEWLTIKRYAERHGLTTQVVTNWMARGVIPADCVRTVPELNDLRLVKDQPYR